MKIDKNKVWQELDLDNRSILFHIIDVGDSALHIGPGMVDTTNDLYDSDPFWDIEYERSDEPEIEVYSVDSYVLGDGECDHADYFDLDYLADLYQEATVFAFDDFLREYAELLCSYKDATVANSCYEEPEEDDADFDYDED